MFRHHAAIGHDVDPHPGEAAGGVIVPDAELEPDEPGAPRQRRQLVDMGLQQVGSPEHVDPLHRVIHEGRAYDVVSVAEDGRREALLIVGRGRAERT